MARIAGVGFVLAFLSFLAPNTGRAALPPVRVAVFDDAAYVDTANLGASSESDNVQASLLELEHAVVAFTHFDLVQLNTALNRADVLLIPEQEIGDLGAALNPVEKNVLAAFVNAGGGLIVHGTNSPSGLAAGLLNQVFALGTTETYSTDVSAAITADTIGTQFAGGPASLADNNATSSLVGLPAGSKVPYITPGGKQTVVLIPRGLGRATYLGYDWYDSVPLGSQDGGWLEALDRAVRDGAGGDADQDGIANQLDLCPQTSSPSQLDTDGDGVGDVCDNCTTISNPRVVAGATNFLALNQWSTLTGGQRDDDHDGYGNKCDAKFPGVSGSFVGSNDLTQFRASNTKIRTDDICGTIGSRPCAIYDLDETGTFIGSGDLSQFRFLNTKAPGPRCATCPLVCDAGATGSCQ